MITASLIWHDSEYFALFLTRGENSRALAILALNSQLILILLIILKLLQNVHACPIKWLLRTRALLNAAIWTYIIISNLVPLSVSVVQLGLPLLFLHGIIRVNSGVPPGFGLGLSNNYTYVGEVELVVDMGSAGGADSIAD